MALDDPAAGRDQPGRVEAEPGQRAGRLPDHHGLVAARGPRHVAEPLDRVHLARQGRDSKHGDSSRGTRDPAGSCFRWGSCGPYPRPRYRPGPWRATRPWTSR